MSDNPFLLPPGGATPSLPPTVPDVAKAHDPERYIAVPASVESATHRIERPAPDSEPIVEPVVEETRVAPAAAPRKWALAMPDGTRVSLDGPLLLGRDPASIPDRSDAQLLALSDRAKTVSKTHALLEPTPQGVRVRELHSTNGVAIDTTAGRELLPAGGEGVAPRGATIMLGSFAIGVAAG
jgi:hypothetical protein